MAPIDTNLADENGCVTDDLLAFYERRARGGVGLLIVENSQVDFPLGKNTKKQLSIHDDAKVEGLRRLSQVIRLAGSRAAIQIHHAGSNPQFLHSPHRNIDRVPLGNGSHIQLHSFDGKLDGLFCRIQCYFFIAYFGPR